MTTRGVSQRLGSRFAQVGINNMLEFGLSTALREDPRYFHSRSDGFLPRLGHAVTSTFLIHKGDGSRAFATSRFAAMAGANFISGTWKPPSQTGARDLATNAGVQVGGRVAINVFREFWPDIRKIFGR